MTYLDPWFRPGAHTRPAVREPARYRDPSFRSSAPPAAVPAVVPRRRGLARFYWGPVVSEEVDRAGDLIRAREVRLPTTVPLCMDRHQSAAVGVAHLFPFRGRVFALAEFAASPQGLAAARTVTYGASIGGMAHGRSGRGRHEIIDVKPTDLTLTDSPLGKGCAVMNMRAVGFGRFAADVLRVR